MHSFVFSEARWTKASVLDSFRQSGGLVTRFAKRLDHELVSHSRSVNGLVFCGSRRNPISVRPYRLLRASYQHPPVRTRRTAGSDGRSSSAHTANGQVWSRGLATRASTTLGIGRGRAIAGIG